MLAPMAIRGKLTRRHDLCNNASPMGRISPAEAASLHMARVGISRHTNNNVAVKFDPGHFAGRPDPLPLLRVARVGSDPPPPRQFESIFDQELGMLRVQVPLAPRDVLSATSVFPLREPLTESPVPLFKQFYKGWIWFEEQFVPTQKKVSRPHGAAAAPPYSPPEHACGLRPT